MVSDLLPGQHVVVVDDDERLLALARLALQKQGIRVSTAATAEEARVRALLRRAPVRQPVGDADTKL
jgi:DNA-binding response OmpR family regulator